MNFLSNIPKEELKDKTVLLRAGLNLPLAESPDQGGGEGGKIVDDFRITQALPSIKYLAEHCKKLIIIAHMGRERTASLAPVIAELQQYLQEYNNIEIRENLRQDPRETSLEETDRDAYAREIVAESGADIFVQDAFSVCHRRHASITSIPKLLPCYAGLLIEQEIEQLEKALNPASPSLFILGGAKFATKEPLIRKFLTLYDHIFIGGAIANEFFKARGYEVGQSLVHDGKIPHDILYNERIILPTTVRVADMDGHTVYVKAQEVMPNMRIVDAVPPSDLLHRDGAPARFVLWNGPLGYYEGGFGEGTDSLLQMLEGRAKKGDISLITGGGDTLATIGAERRDIFTHISAGGGAMLTYLQEGSLIGLTALE